MCQSTGQRGCHDGGSWFGIARGERVCVILGREGGGVCDEACQLNGSTIGALSYRAWENYDHFKDSAPVERLSRSA